MSLTKDDFAKTKPSDDGKEYVKFTLEDAIIPPNTEAKKQSDVTIDEDENEGN